MTATVAVKVTVWPETELPLVDEVTAVVVFALFTVCVIAVDVDGALLSSPP